MKIAVIADSHNRLPGGLTERLAHADEIWHLGDVCRPETLAPLEALPAPLLLVRGNNDVYPGWPEKRIREWHGTRCLLIHIRPRKPVSDIDIVLFGHTHRPCDDFFHGTRFLNPGCLTRPNRGAPRSFAWLEINENAPPKWRLVLLD